MHYSLIVKILGLLLMLFSAIANLPPMLVSLLYSDGMMAPFVESFFTVFGTGLAMWLTSYRAKSDLGTRDGFLIVTLFWAVLGSAGSLPFIFSSAVELSITDAVFESLSGLTTDRRHGDLRARFFAAVDPVLSPAATVAWRHGHHRAGDGAAAHAGNRRHAALPRGESRPGQRQ
jgi:Trk-type K+ transport system membrane component